MAILFFFMNIFYIILFFILILCLNMFLNFIFFKIEKYFFKRMKKKIDKSKE